MRHKLDVRFHLKPKRRPDARLPRLVLTSKIRQALIKAGEPFLLNDWPRYGVMLRKYGAAGCWLPVCRKLCCPYGRLGARG